MYVCMYVCMYALKQQDFEYVHALYVCMYVCRRDKRIDNWRDFQTEPEAKKLKVLLYPNTLHTRIHITYIHTFIQATASYKEERREDTKHGVVKLETWKKQWKWRFAFECYYVLMYMYVCMYVCMYTYVYLFGSLYIDFLIQITYNFCTNTQQSYGW